MSPPAEKCARQVNIDVVGSQLRLVIISIKLVFVFGLISHWIIVQYTLRWAVWMHSRLFRGFQRGFHRLTMFQPRDQLYQIYVETLHETSLQKI